MTMTTPAPAGADQDCGCPENRGLSRRSLFRMAGIAGVVTATTLSDVRLAFGAAGTGVLVVLSLRGGFDGLSAIVPNGDPNYAKLRPNLHVPATATKKIDGMFGLHPALAPLYDLWDAGTFGAVHAVGQADPTRSHFEAMAEMERAAPSSSLRTGWIDRTLGAVSNPSDFAGTQVGSASLPASMIGPHAKFSMGSIAGVKLAIGEDLVPFKRWGSAMKTLHKGTRLEVGAPISDALDAVGKMQGMAKAEAGQPDPKIALGYPPNDGLANALHDVASLVKADLGLKVATVDSGNWDMHVGMGNAQGGWMFNNLTSIAKSLAAFAKDLGDDLSKVTLVTLSEFGRRCEENGSGGLDHGHGNAVLVLGGGIKGGQVHGRWPGLGPNDLVDGDLDGTTDYRSIIAEILTKRVGVGQTGEVFPNYKPKPVGLV